MRKSLRQLALVLPFLIFAVCALPALGQPQAPQPPAAPPGLRLNPVQQAYLDQVLSTWETESAKVTIFECPFELWEYRVGVRPGNGIPLNKNKGQLSYQKPDKGSFEITEIRVWTENPTPPGGQRTGDWVLQKDAIGEHWVCDGKNVYEYRQQQKQLVVSPIPPAMQGKAIVDGPLPFLFGAEAAKLKARYWMRADQMPDNSDEILIQAWPRFQADAADYKQVDLMLDRQRMMPKAIKVHLPNGDRNLYMFDIANAAVNGHLQRIMALFRCSANSLGLAEVWLSHCRLSSRAAPPDGRQATQPDGLPR